MSAQASVLDDGLSADALREFQDILGERNVSDDPAVIASYCWVTSTGGDVPARQLYDIRPIAVVMPSSTQEVQAVVKTCLRHGLKFLPHSTGTASFGCVKQKGTVSIDLRRMNRIVEIDAKNQMAVIEPYVTAAQLQAEAMKVGLTSHIIGAGWTHSPLASSTSCGGIGISGNHTGHNVHNMMAYEWVTPQGEIVHGGSAGAGVGWFAGEGPGPGFRGMIRGAAGAMGGLGIFTRIGYKLHPWAGPARLNHRGSHPQWGIELTQNMHLYQVAWNDWKDAADAMYELMISNAATFAVRIPPDHYGWILYPTNGEFYQAFATGKLPPVARNENHISWTLMTVSDSAAEEDWRDRTIRSIVSGCGGRLVELTKEHAEVIARNLVTASYIPRVFRSGPRQTITSAGIYDSMRLLPDAVKASERLMQPYKNERKTLAVGSPEEFWLWPTEGRYLWGENIVNAHNESKTSAAEAYAFVVQTMEENERRPVGTAAFALGPLMADIYGVRNGVNTWMRKVKAKFDPQSVADGHYPRNEPMPPVAKLWPVVRPLFARFPSLLRKAMRVQIKNSKA